MDARSIIAKLRQGEVPTAVELEWFAWGIADLTVSDAQAGAFAMAVCLNGLGEQGRVALTRAMQASGDTLEWDVDGPVLDKHSTGGIGDCVSLALAPALAACGAFVPMISGRGLGHTGGTLDKLESIPGLTVEANEEKFRDIVSWAGCAIVAASNRVAPADRRLYAIRDVTATVESLDLITASILSKKLAAGIECLVLDVKVGSGAFMKDLSKARALAGALVDTATAAGCPTTAVITDMNQPLAPALGNALEMAEVMRLLTGEAKGPLLEITAVLGGILLANSQLAADVEDGAQRIVRAIMSGEAAERMGRMVALMGGPLEFVANWARFLPEAPVIREVVAQRDGFVTAIDGEYLGLSVVSLGGGRQVESDKVNPSVGISELVRLGAAVERGQVIARVHAAREDAARLAVGAVQSAISVGERPGVLPPLFYERIG